jgi:hypothetical protein
MMPTETDPILEEVYRLRDEHAKRFNYDLNAIIADIQSRTMKSGRTFVTLDEADESTKQPNSNSPMTTNN